jgi:mono/diheme cytochrome c family protein
MARETKLLRQLVTIAASVLITNSTVGALAADNTAELARGWKTLRAMDCARCHGRDYQGWTAPSLINAVRDAPRSRFDHYVLEGDIGRGMPGYRTQPAVADNLDAIYAYLMARAKGEIGPGDPEAKQQAPQPAR